MIFLCSHVSFSKHASYIQPGAAVSGPICCDITYSTAETAADYELEHRWMLRASLSGMSYVDILEKSRKGDTATWEKFKHNVN